MTWYRRFLTSTRKIVLSPNVYNDLENLARKISIGDRDWSEKDLQLQANHPEALEWFLRKLQKETQN